MNDIQKKIFEQYKKSRLDLAEKIKEYQKEKGIRGSPDKEGVADLITCIDFITEKNILKIN